MTAGRSLRGFWARLDDRFLSWAEANGREAFRYRLCVYLGVIEEDTEQIRWDR
jgi:hypothetical protein